MPVITLQTVIDAPIEIVFDLARSIDLHKISTAATKEEAVAGKTSGLIGLGESVTWRARHFRVTQKLTSKITEYIRPFYFVDEMVDGAFAHFKHEHIFSSENGSTVMKDVFNYRSPFGIIGRIADVLFLEKYMQNLLSGRNEIVKQFAEDEDKYKAIILQS